MTRSYHPMSIEAVLVSVIVIRGAGEQTQILMMRRRNPPAGTWAQVVGKIEAGETAWQAGLRELSEETGLVPDKFYSADTHEQFYKADRDCITIAPVFVARAADDAQVNLNAEHDDMAWLDFDTAIDLVSFGGQRRILRDVRDEFVRRRPSPYLLIPHGGTNPS